MDNTSWRPSKNQQATVTEAELLRLKCDNIPHFSLFIQLSDHLQCTPALLHASPTSLTYDPTSHSHPPACTNMCAPTVRLPKNDPHTRNRCLWAWPVCLLRLYYLTGTVYAATCQYPHSFFFFFFSDKAGRSALCAKVPSCFNQG